MRRKVLLVGLVLLAGCGAEAGAGSRGGAACTAIGAVHGIGVTVAADLAPVRGLVFTVCADDGCTDVPVGLIPGSSVSEESCTGDGPDDSCSAGLTPDGTQFGHVPLERPPGPVEVSARYRLDGRTVELPPTTVELETSYPNGRDCGADGTQGQVTVSASGLG